MRVLTGLIIALITFSTVVMMPVVLGETAVGIQRGDWCEYSANVTGGTPPPKLDLRSFRMEILEVKGSAFEVNFTTRFNNGTIANAIWRFNFTEGNVGGWTIIPANLSVGDSFYDCNKPGNVTIEGKEQKVVAGAIRTITFASDAKREIKEWDQKTGIYTYSVEHPRNLTLTTAIVATNLWSAQTAQAQSAKPIPYISIAMATLAIQITAITVIVAYKKRLSWDSPRHQKFLALIILAVLLLAVSSIGTIPMTESGLPLSFREINVIMQTFWMSFLLVGMWFRSKGNYFLHEVCSIITVAATLVSFALVLFMSLPGTNDMAVYFSTALNLWVVLAHSVVSLPALVFGVWLVTLWRPNSSTYAAKSNRIAQLTMIFWILSYIVGIADFVVLRTTIFTQKVVY